MLAISEFVRKVVGRIFPSKLNLDGGGERVDIIYAGDLKYETMDMYQKSHCKRYEFARSVITPGKTTGDFASGTGYGSVILAECSHKVIGVDVDTQVVNEIRLRYKEKANVEFVCSNLLDLQYESQFDNIVSFETIEHLQETDIPKLYSVFGRALKRGGTLVFSTPYMQPKSPEAMKMGFHLTFGIDEAKINSWLAASGFAPKTFKYQNYKTHMISDNLAEKDFIICVAYKD